MNTNGDVGASGDRLTATEAIKSRACINCARLKMKMSLARSWGQSRGGRCARMKIPCHVPAPVPRKKRGKSTYVSLSIDVADLVTLERKIDGLVSMLASGQHIHASGTPPLTPESLSKRPSQHYHNPTESPMKRPKIPLAIPSEPATAFQLIPGFGVSLEEVISYFDIYRREFMPNYPFCHHPRESRSSVLSSATQQGVENWFRQYITDRMVVKQERNLGILQALLLHLACISALFKRGNHCPWNNYLSQCCESLAEPPLASDLFPVALVNMQRVADRANSILPGFDVVDTTLSTYLWPMDMIINNVRRELHDLMTIQPDCVKSKSKSQTPISPTQTLINN
ncbi:hypothetical protein CCMA1212_006871 [Trichoderma ghanense]|uniref:Uncharacterized protein n=1 Tax=Trichoderma ghanense TaxID=65468 RepID=A0ABY2GYM2_9HYPO